LTCFDNLTAAEETWRRFEQGGICSFFQTYDWLVAWYECLGRNNITPQIVAVRDHQNSDLALLPMAIKPGRWARGLIWLGSDTSIYQGPILTQRGIEAIDDTFIEKLFSRIRKEVFDFDYADLDRQPAYFGDHANPFASHKASSKNAHAHSTHLVGDWATYYASKRSGKTRREERRKLTKLKQVGEVDFTIASSPDHINALMDELIREKSRQFRELGVKNAFGNERRCALFRTAALKLAADDRVQLSAITLDGKPISINYAVIHNGEYQGIFLCHAGDHIRKFGPGMMLIHRIFQWCFANGIEHYDFSVGDHDYKSRWCEKANPLSRSIWPATPRGRPYAWFAKLSLSLEKTVKSSPSLSRIANRILKTKQDLHKAVT